MKLFTYKQGPSFPSEDTQDVVNRLQRACDDTRELKFVSVNGQDGVAAILFPVRDTHSTTGSIFAQMKNAQISGGGFVKINEEKMEVEEVRFSSDSLKKNIGRDRPDSPEEASRILEEIRTEVNQLLATLK